MCIHIYTYISEKGPARDPKSMTIFEIKANRLELYQTYPRLSSGSGARSHGAAWAHQAPWAPPPQCNLAVGRLSLVFLVHADSHSRAQELFSGAAVRLGALWSPHWREGWGDGRGLKLPALSPGAGRAAPHESPASTTGTRDLLQEQLEIEQWDFPEEGEDPVVQIVKSCMLEKQEVLHTPRLSWVLPKIYISIQTFSVGYNQRDTSKKTHRHCLCPEVTDKIKS